MSEPSVSPVNRPTCAACRHFHDTGYAGAGECRIRAPRLAILPRGAFDRAFPPVTADDWCGQHQSHPRTLDELIQGWTLLCGAE